MNQLAIVRIKTLGKFNVEYLTYVLSVKNKKDSPLPVVNVPEITFNVSRRSSKIRKGLRNESIKITG